MIIWLNGTFGAGKTTTAGKLAELLPQARFFDTEQVGGMLATVPDLPELGDFQHWPPWRHLVVETASQLLDYVGGILVVPQTVLVKQYWDEISTGLAEAGIEVHHYVLHTDRDTLAHRIVNDRPTGHDWRLRHLTDYEEALPWLRDAAQIVDTTHRQPKDVAKAIADDAGALG
ncbi:AAA family ATPase [Streptomyces bathyalis]|uniref:AAA family ATPase n=1 Tax=Streptomyces bathyalis TaxID=2710756 RepID=A0A7T1WQZ9_9ACTN|nr:AAA family ATPase [Streptomyces bathyalis]QPP07478.1 AAA family ATPase [Streptomyces bathyalis]